MTNIRRREHAHVIARRHGHLDSLDQRGPSERRHHLARVAIAVGDDHRCVARVSAARRVAGARMGFEYPPQVPHRFDRRTRRQQGGPHHAGVHERIPRILARCRATGDFFVADPGWCAARGLLEQADERAQHVCLGRRAPGLRRGRRIRIEQDERGAARSHAVQQPRCLERDPAAERVADDARRPGRSGIQNGPRVPARSRFDGSVRRPQAVQPARLQAVYRYVGAQHARKRNERRDAAPRARDAEHRRLFGAACLNDDQAIGVRRIRIRIRLRLSPSIRVRRFFADRHGRSAVADVPRAQLLDVSGKLDDGRTREDRLDRYGHAQRVADTARESKRLQRRSSERAQIVSWSAMHDARQIGRDRGDARLDARRGIRIASA
ncbi:hctF domain protein [Burkholderia pseudomallei]|nr:hctF domain protein [Burkholderia pseudomallei]